MTSPDIVLSGDSTRDIHTLATAIGSHVAAQWEQVLVTHREKLLDAYDRAGDAAYGTYCNYLFRAVHTRLKEVGLKPEPELPGDFDISREWGNRDETDQQRWMWSTITRAATAPDRSDREAIGTIVVVLFHDHTRFRIPREPQVFALPESGKTAVVAALSARSADFTRAREASIEIAEYLASLEQTRNRS